jgi:hypothetical protein
LTKFYGTLFGFLVVAFIIFALPKPIHKKVFIERHSNNSSFKVCNSGQAGNDFSAVDPQDLELKIVFSKPERWFANLKLAVEDGTNNPFSNGQLKLFEKYRKYFDAKIILTDLKNANRCFHFAKIRLTGDFLDHIDPIKNAYSVKVKVKNGNLFGATKFKLFVPSAKGGESEVLSTFFARKLGFLSPMTALIGVSLPGSELRNMLFQEDLDTNFLQKNSMREGPFVESNEYYKIEDGRLKDFDVRYSFAQISNGNYVEKGSDYALVGIKAITNLNAALLEHQHDMHTKGKCCVNSYTDRFENDTLANSDLNAFTQFKLFDAYLEATKGQHGLVPTNRKFYFDPLYSRLVPVVYDSNPDFSAIIQKIIDRIPPKTESEHIISLKLILAFELETLKELELLGLSDKGLELLGKIEGYFRTNFDPIALNKKIALLNSKLRSENDSKITNREIQTNFLNYGDAGTKVFSFYNSQDSSFERCVAGVILCSVEKLKTTDLAKRVVELNGNKTDEHFLGMFSRDGAILTRNTLKKYKYVRLNEISMRLYGKAQVQVDEEKRIIKFSNISRNNAAVIENSLLRGWTVFVQGNENMSRFESENSSIDRVDKNGLTGCLTLLDSRFDGLRIHASNNGCEDALNIVRSSGNIREVSVNSSAADAIDVDFSELTVWSATVSNAGNDCIDFSGSQVVLKNGLFSKCGDKAVSVGEESVVKLIDITIENAFTGIASKDSSIVNVGNVALSNVEDCFAAYRKKPAFHTGTLNINFKGVTGCGS